MKILICLGILLLCLPVFSQTSYSVVSVKNLRGSWAIENKLANPDWEQSTRGWSVTGGTYVRTRATSVVSSVFRGLWAGSWDGTTNDVLQSHSIPVTGQPAANSLYTFSCMARSEGTATTAGASAIQIRLHDGTNTIAGASAYISNSYWSRIAITGVVPNSGNIHGRLVLQANEPKIFLDDCYLGPAEDYHGLSVITGLYPTRRERICRAVVAGGGACASSPCTITSQNGCVTSVTRSTTGTYKINLDTMAYSSAPTCIVWTNQGQVLLQSTYVTQTSIDFLTTNSGGTANDASNMQMLCSGPY